MAADKLPAPKKEGKPKRLAVGVDGVTFGSRLKKLREAKGFDKTQLAAKAGVSSQSIDLYEGDARAPGFVNGLHLATALGVAPHVLAGESAPAMPEDHVPDGSTLVPTSALDALRELIQGLPQEVAELTRRIRVLEGNRSPQQAIPTSNARSK